MGTDWMSFFINGELFWTKLVWEYNMYNLTAAYLVLQECWIYLRDMREINPVPWRFERFEIEWRTVILDYAHTINSLEQTLQLIKELYWREKIVTVFGCWGDRDKTKRKPMWEIALHYSEKVYVTTDNPRWEEPEDIIDDICWDNDRFLIIEDREEAIHQAIKNNPDSVILIAGRGNEEVTYIKGKEYPMKDRDFILNYK
jgi:UDP-N-acetylmuramoyl-L-alanyl-D-glutamate--2,6-diaminopimelate ligase